MKEIIVGAEVIPLHFLGVTDLDLSRLPLNDLMMNAMNNMVGGSEEESYAVRHSGHPVPDFGRFQGSERTINPLAATFPKLFPFGVGGIESDRRKMIGFQEHVRWALQYYDRRFHIHHTFPFVTFSMLQKREALNSARVQMHRKDFERDSLALCSVTVEDLRQAQEEEAEQRVPSNPRVRVLRKHMFASSTRVTGSDNCRTQYHGHIWGTCLHKGGPSIWLTINPSDIHDPIAQIFVGKQINMDEFCASMGPDSNRRAQNIARDPYAAAKYFFFIIDAILRTLFQVEATQNQVTSGMGILGRISAYFGVVEAQGRGTLHLHMLIWCCNSPNMYELHDLMRSKDFHNRLHDFIRQNIRAHLDGLDEETIRKMPKESELAYAQCLNPDSPTWAKEMHDREHRVVRSSQIHTCTRATCLQFNRYGNLVCKRRAPWRLSAKEYVDEHGDWNPKRTFGFVNNYCPAISTTICCNNDIKLLTNGKDTKDVTWYTIDYATKKQSKNNNVSALMAKALLYHQDHCDHIDSLVEANRMLLFRCQQAINHEMELSGPQVISYLMGWGDNVHSHHYVPLYWSSVRRALLSTFPQLNPGQQHRQVLKDIMINVGEM